MFATRESTRIVYYDFDRAWVEQIPLGKNPRFSPINKMVSLEDLPGELEATGKHLAQLAREYEVAAEIIRKVGQSKVKEAIAKASAIACVYIEFEPDFEVVDCVDRDALAVVEQNYGKLNTLDRYILTGIGMDQLLKDAGEVIVAAYGKDNLYNE